MRGPNEGGRGAESFHKTTFQTQHHCCENPKEGVLKFDVCHILCFNGRFSFLPNICMRDKNLFDQRKMHLSAVSGR